jgi:hypothetical protein
VPWGEVNEVIGPVRLVLAGKDDKVSGDDLRSRLGVIPSSWWHTLKAVSRLVCPSCSTKLSCELIKLRPAVVAHAVGSWLFTVSARSLR